MIGWYNVVTKVSIVDLCNSNVFFLIVSPSVFRCCNIVCNGVPKGIERKPSVPKL